jgi:tetratricopeptide (TPR) repeat protein
MGALPRPDLPDGAVRVLFDSLHELHHVAGWPSLRDMAKAVGCSHTTVSVAFSGPRVPRWGLLELLVEALSGDTDRFHRLWLAASVAERGGGTPPASDSCLAVADSSPVSRRVSTQDPPRQLPTDTAAFTGRADQLAQLDHLLQGSRTGVVISVVCGTAGVGKTALAAHWAHRVADQFPDGQLYLNLRGYDPERPMQPAEALGVMLRALGVEDAAVPHEVAEAAARYRTLLAGRRMLVLLDNAHSVDQVRDLLPGTESCLVVVTSRASLPALVARHGAVRIDLDLLPLAEAVALLRTLIGDRVDAEPGQAEALALRCARLPLALRIAAELVASRPAVTLAALADELGDERRRLDLLAAGEDDYTAVRTVFSWSCRHLSPPALRAFRLLGLHPGPDINTDAAAALFGTDPAGARHLIDVLARAHLVEEHAHGRFGMHDLLRAYAAEQATGCAEREQRAALAELLDYFLHTATAATAVAFPHDPWHRPAGITPARHFVGACEGRAWLDTELPNLLATAQSAAAGPGYASRLSATLTSYLDVCAHYAEALTLHDLACQAARTSRDQAGEAAALNLLGTVHLRLGHYPDAFVHHERALSISHDIVDRTAEAAARYGLATLCWRSGRLAEARDHAARALTIRRETGDRIGEGAVLYRLGTVFHRLGRYHDAIHHHRQALAISREIGDRVSESRALNNLGITFERMGEYRQAIDQYQRSIAIFRELGNRVGIAVALTNLGNTDARLGRFDEALEQHLRSLPIYRETGNRVGEGEALHGLGLLYRRWGRYSEATRHLQQALAIGRGIGEVNLESTALIELAETLRAAGRPDGAEVHCRSGLALADQIDDRYLRAGALTCLAHLRRDAGDPTTARQLWQQALALYTDLDLPEAHEVQAYLACLPDTQPARPGATPRVRQVAVTTETCPVP